MGEGPLYRYERVMPPVKQVERGGRGNEGNALKYMFKFA